MGDIGLSQYSAEQQSLLIGNFEELVLSFQTYTSIQSINAWLIMVVLVFDIKFVGQVGIIMEIIERALMDLFFFILMFLNVRLLLSEVMII